MARSLNKAELIGNLTRDPELRYTPQGTAVCTFGLATNRQWTTDAGEKKEDAEFHRIVAWNKLAELCAQLLSKGRKVYVEGRLQTRRWTSQDGQERTTTEIVINDMIILDSKFSAKTGEDFDVPDEPQLVQPAAEVQNTPEVSTSSPKLTDVKKKKKAKTSKELPDEPSKNEAPEEDIPF